MVREILDEHFVQQLCGENSDEAHVLPFTQQMTILATDFVDKFCNFSGMEIAFFPQAFFGEKILNIWKRVSHQRNIG